MPEHSARAIALTALAEIRSRDAWAHEVVDGVLKGSSLSGLDRSYVTRVVYGVAQTSGTLDEVLDQKLNKPSRVHPAVRDVLRLGSYELLFDRGDAHAVVDEAVGLARRIAPHAAGMVNAVLRKIADSAETFPWGDPSIDIGAAARAHGHPLWLASRLADDLGVSQALGVMEANNMPAPLYIAHNPFAGPETELFDALASDGARPRPTPLEGCLEAQDPSAAVRGDALKQGLGMVADAGAQLVATLASPAPGGIAVDIGSGRGTKSALMARAAAGSAEIVGVDIHDFKATIASGRMKELRIPGVRQVVVDATDNEALFAAVGSEADIVLIDAPCSGLGALRRMPDKRWRIEPDDIVTLSELGSSLLMAASNLVRSSGVVVYSTCTVLPQENSQVVDGFLASTAGQGFDLEDVADYLPDEWSQFRTNRGFLQTLQAPGGPDGHFAAIMRKS